MASCHLCPENPPDTAILEHIRLMHPDYYGDGPEQWPDGGLVIEDASVETPDDAR